MVPNPERRLTIVKVIVDTEYIKNRPAEKQRMRDEDHRRLKSGEVTARQLREENSIFAEVDMSKARIVSIGKRKLKYYQR